jgi:hypothetical protein
MTGRGLSAVSCGWVPSCTEGRGPLAAGTGFRSSGDRSSSSPPDGKSRGFSSATWSSAPSSVVHLDRHEDTVDGDVGFEGGEFILGQGRQELVPLRVARGWWDAACPSLARVPVLMVVTCHDREGDKAVRR